MALILIFSLSTPATALGKCNVSQVDPSRANKPSEYFWIAATNSIAGIVGGVYSQIKTYSPWVSNGAFSYAWVMLTRSGSYYWAQIGPHEVVNGARDTHIQTANGSSSSVWDLNLGSTSVGSLNYDTILYDPPSNRYQFQINSNTYHSTTSLTWFPTAAQIASEITNLNTQMMGATSVHEQFNSNHLYYNNQWYAFGGSPFLSSSNGTNPATWFGYSGTAAGFQGWDKTCSS